jgi:hypothetical protein
MSERVSRRSLFSNLHPHTVTSENETESAPQEQFENREDKREPGVDEMSRSYVFHIKISEKVEAEEREG